MSVNPLKTHLSDLPSYMRPLYSFPESKETFYNVPKIQVDKPFNSPPKNYNIKTSYANSFSSRLKNKNIQDTAMRIIGNNSIFYDTTAIKTQKISKESKNLSNVADFVTGDSAIYGKKIVTPNINSTIEFRPENFEKVTLKVNSPYVSEGNKDWIIEQQKQKLAKKFNQGVYIPSVSQLQMYGRKDQKSKFEAHELWKQNLEL